MCPVEHVKLWNLVQFTDNSPKGLKRAREYLNTKTASDEWKDEFTKPKTVQLEKHVVCVRHVRHQAGTDAERLCALADVVSGQDV